MNAAYREIIDHINRAASSTGASLNEDQEDAALAAISPLKRTVAYCKRVAGPENMRSCLVKTRTGSPQPIHDCVLSRAQEAVRGAPFTYCMTNKHADKLIRQTCMMGLMELSKTGG